MLNSLQSDAERARIAWIFAEQDFGLRDIIKYGLIALGYAMHPQIYDSADGLSSLVWIRERIAATGAPVGVEEIAAAGLRVLARLNEPAEGPGERLHMANDLLRGRYTPRLDDGRSQLGNPYTGTVLLSSMGFTAACMVNSRLLGLFPHDLLNDDFESPFVREPDASPASHSDDEPPYQEIKPDLRPTSEQIAIPHHPYLDVIPWPSFRARALVAVSMEPPMIDESELCLDLMNNGIRCWGMTAGSLHGRGEGTAWDSRSWEAMPWFLEKWAVLGDKVDGEMHRTSAWWRAQRSQGASI
jgi:hypothetical protein